MHDDRSARYPERIRLYRSDGGAVVAVKEAYAELLEFPGELRAGGQGGAALVSPNGNIVMRYELGGVAIPEVAQ